MSSRQRRTVSCADKRKLDRGEKGERGVISDSGCVRRFSERLWRSKGLDRGHLASHRTPTLNNGLSAVATIKHDKSRAAPESLL